MSYYSVNTESKIVELQRVFELTSVSVIHHQVYKSESYRGHCASLCNDIETNHLGLLYNVLL